MVFQHHYIFIGNVYCSCHYYVLVLLLICCCCCWSLKRFYYILEFTHKRTFSNMFFYFHCCVDFYITSFKTCLGFYIFDWEVVRIKHFQKRKRNLCKNILGSLFCGNFFALVFLLITEAAIRGALCKKVFLEISQHSQENACARASFSIKLQA